MAPGGAGRRVGSGENCERGEESATPQRRRRRRRRRTVATQGGKRDQVRRAHGPATLRRRSAARGATTEVLAAGRPKSRSSSDNPARNYHNIARAPACHVPRRRAHLPRSRCGLLARFQIAFPAHHGRRLEGGGGDRRAPRLPGPHAQDLPGRARSCKTRHRAHFGEVTAGRCCGGARCRQRHPRSALQLWTLGGLSSAPSTRWVQLGDGHAYVAALPDGVHFVNGPWPSGRGIIRLYTSTGRSSTPSGTPAGYAWR